MQEIQSNGAFHACIDAFASCIINAGGDEFDTKKLVASYILVHKAGIGLGTAFKKGIFDQNHATYAALNGVLHSALV